LGPSGETSIVFGGAAFFGLGDRFADFFAGAQFRARLAGAGEAFFDIERLR
jgi:hypothetical protein